MALFLTSKKKAILLRWISPVDEANGPIWKCVQCVCHHTLPCLISFSLDLDTHMPSSVNSILALLFCFFGFTNAIAASSNSSEATGRIAEARDSWLAAFKSKDVGAAVDFYASDAAFLQPSGDRIEGIESIRELYQKIVMIFDTNLEIEAAISKCRRVWLITQASMKRP